MIKKNHTKKTARPIHRMVRENALDVEDLSLEPLNTANESEAQDRSENLANMRDPFVQEPELIQHGSADTLKDDESLADHFDKERGSEPAL